MTPVLTSNGQKLKSGEVLAYFQHSLAEVSARRKALYRARKTPIWQRILGYPLVMLSLLSLTAISLLCVILNVGQIVAGFRTLDQPVNEFDTSVTCNQN
jgi:hypothetical protein